MRLCRFGGHLHDLGGNPDNFVTNDNFFVDHLHLVLLLHQLFFFLPITCLIFHRN